MHFCGPPDPQNRLGPFGDVRAPAVTSDDQSLVLECPESLGHGGRRDLVTLGQYGHGRELVPRLKLPGLNLLPQVRHQPLAGWHGRPWWHVSMIPSEETQVTVFILFGKFMV